MSDFCWALLITLGISLLALWRVYNAMKVWRTMFARADLALQDLSSIETPHDRFRPEVKR